MFLQVISDNVGDVFSTFLHISTNILLSLHSLGSAEANTESVGKLSRHLMASFVENIHTRNYVNLITFLEVTTENARDVF